jgi:beta-glucosidase
VNLEMPHADYLNEPAVRDLLEGGQIVSAEIDRMVAGTLASFFRFGFYDREQLDPDAHAFGGWHDEVALETSRQGHGAPRNEGDFLPLDPDPDQAIVLLGANARETETSGYGAARVEPTNPVSILASFKRARATASRSCTSTRRPPRRASDARPPTRRSSPFHARA